MRSGKNFAALALLALATVFALSACAAPTATGSGSAPDTVTALGNGTGSAAPDTAQFSLGVTSSAKDRITAQDGASKTAAAIIAAVKGAGIDAVDIQTGQISLNQQFGPNGQPTGGFTASQSITVKTKLVDKVGAAVAAATGAGATDVSGPQFSLSDSNAAGIDAIGKAMADAKARAAAMAKAAGRTLGRVVSVTEAPQNQVVPFAASASASAGKTDVVPPVEPGQVESTVQLTVVFALQ